MNISISNLAIQHYPHHLQHYLWSISMSCPNSQIYFGPIFVLFAITQILTLFMAFIMSQRDDTRTVAAIWSFHIMQLWKMPALELQRSKIWESARISNHKDIKHQSTTFTGGSKLLTRIPRSISLSSNFLMKGWFWNWQTRFKHRNLLTASRYWLCS